MKNAALIIVDAQRDFLLPGRPLAPPHAERIIPIINTLKENFLAQHTVYTSDWHPKNHISFISSHKEEDILPYPPSKVCPSSPRGDSSSSEVCPPPSVAIPPPKTPLPPSGTTPTAEDMQVPSTLHPRSTSNPPPHESNSAPPAPMYVTAPNGDDVCVWATHCVGGSEGAEFHEDLKIDSASKIIKKGVLKDVESLSGFGCSEAEVTELEGLLRKWGVEDVYVCGVCMEVCVCETAVDAMKRGFRIVVISDASAGWEGAEEKLKSLGIPLKSSSEVSSELLR